MTDYYKLPATPEKKRNFDGAILLLLLLLLLGIGLTLWSLRQIPEASGVLQAASLPSAPVAEPARAAPAPSATAPEPGPVLAPESLPEAIPTPPPPPALFSDARWRETARFTGQDAAGRSAEFTAYVLVGAETWTFARADQIFAAGLSEPVETAFANLNLGEGVCSLSRVIAVGAASVEGTPAMNVFLSGSRGRALGVAIAVNLPACAGNGPATSVLDLGYNSQPVDCPSGEAVCPALSAPQRPIAMILAVAQDPETDLAGALQAGIAAHESTGARVLPGVSIADYSGFDLR